MQGIEKRLPVLWGGPEEVIRSDTILGDFFLGWNLFA